MIRVLLSDVVAKDKDHVAVKPVSKVILGGVLTLGSATVSTAAGADRPGGIATECEGSIGPDVIVADITGPTNYQPFEGLDALSLGTTSCNMGTLWLKWLQNGTEHPVIAGNLYKFKTVNGSGRFEQIGMNWLKHGFYAVNETLCCPECEITDGTHLGVGCSDPYTSERNGHQYFLSPRWQVNAHTGAFTYPGANPPFKGSTARRIEAALSDLEVSSAQVRYFGENQYISPDDAAAGNQNNNVSHRELSAVVEPEHGGYDFALIRETQRERPAIRAWKDIDPGVVLVDAQVAGDGLFILAHRVTPFGAGQWHYEYAMYNMNSDRGGQSFSLPIVACVNVTNIGFHDVPYRNGDGPGHVNFSGVDWIFSRSLNSLTWATQTFAQNQSANAIRWGSTYNFRFDANSPPTAGNITLGLFKTGTPALISIAAQIPTSIATPSCPADIAPPAGNGKVDTDDLLVVINNWGHAGGPGDIPAGCGSGIVNVDDLLWVINTWGFCQ